MNKPNVILTYKYLIVACLVSVMVSTFTSYFFYNKWNEAEDRAVSLLSERNMLTEKYNVIKSAFDKTFNDMMIMRDENSRVYTLQSTDSTKRYFARVYWNPYTRETYIDVLSLPQPDSSNQYQLWALVGGQPVSAGLFSADGEEGAQHVKPVANAETWAATIEPKGGSITPTLDRMFLASKN